MYVYIPEGYQKSVINSESYKTCTKWINNTTHSTEHSNLSYISRKSKNHTLNKYVFKFLLKDLISWVSDFRAERSINWGLQRWMTVHRWIVHRFAFLEVRLMRLTSGSSLVDRWWACWTCTMVPSGCTVL